MNWFNWYWGPNKGIYSAGTVGTLYTVNAGIMLAGPKLTPQTFQQGLFAMPAYGGAATNQLQSFMFGYGRTSGLPYDEYATVGLDYAVMWWNPTDVGKGKILFDDGTGRFCYTDSAKRYYAEQWPKTATEAVRHEQLDLPVRLAAGVGRGTDVSLQGMPEHEELTDAGARSSNSRNG